MGEAPKIFLATAFRLPENEGNALFNVLIYVNILENQLCQAAFFVIARILTQGKFKQKDALDVYVRGKDMI